MIETIDSIIQWHKAAFPDASLEGQLDKYQEEAGEFNDSEHKDICELADMLIVACGISRFSLSDAAYAFGDVALWVEELDYTWEQLERSVEAKMELNRKRKWRYKNGNYRHVEDK